MVESNGARAVRCAVCAVVFACMIAAVSSTPLPSGSSAASSVSPPSQSSSVGKTKASPAPTMASNPGPDPNGGGDEDGDEDGDGDHEDRPPPTFPAYTGFPRRNWTVCSSAGILTLKDLQLFQYFACEIINGSLILEISDSNITSVYDIQLPALLHVTAQLSVSLPPGWSVRDLLPNLVAVHGLPNSVQFLAAFELFLRIPYEDSANITAFVSRGAFSNDTDGIAFLRGRVAYYTQGRTVYARPPSAVTPVPCSPEAGSLPGVSGGVFVDGQPVSLGNATHMCCKPTYDKKYLCPYLVNLACLTNAREASLGNRTEADIVMQQKKENTKNITISSSDQAIVCKYYAGPGLDQCVNTCPTDTALFADAVCLRRCPTIRVPDARLLKITLEPYYSVYNATSKQYVCERTCPPFQQADPATSSCQKCVIDEDQYGVPCRRECNGVVVKSLTQLCSFVGCTDVRGDLFLSINNPGLIPQCLHQDTGITTLDSAMDKALGSVKRIFGLLLIFGNLCMTNLNFFRNLEAVLVRKSIAENYRILIKDNPVLTDVSGLTQLGQIGPHELDIQLAHAVTANFRIDGNAFLCNAQIDRLYEQLLGEYYINMGTRPHFHHPYANADQLNCPVTRFQIRAVGVIEDSITISWDPPVPRGTDKLLKLYLFYVETRNSIDPHLRDVIKLSGNTTDFSCAARLEPWSVISLPANITSYTVRNLHFCSEYAFAIDAFFNRTTGSPPTSNLVIGNTSNIVLGRPKNPSSPPGPGLLRITSADAESISLTWKEPNLQCQEFGVPFTYRVYWAIITIYPPVTSLTLEACGALCACADHSFLDPSTTAGQLMEQVQRQYRGRFVVTARDSPKASLSPPPAVPNLITPAGCNSTESSTCCPEGLFIHVEDLNRVNQGEGLFNLQHSKLTQQRNFTLKRNITSRLSTYIFAVQVYHGKPTDTYTLSTNQWALAANVTENTIADTIPDFKVNRTVFGESSDVELSWTDPPPSDSPVIRYQVLMTARVKSFGKNTSQVEEYLGTEIVQCLMEYCAGFTGNGCVNITMETEGGTIPVAVAVTLHPALIAAEGSRSTVTLRRVSCLNPHYTDSVRDVIVHIRSITVSGCGPWSDLGSIIVQGLEAEGTPATNADGASPLGAGEYTAIAVPISLLVILCLVLYAIKLRRSKAKSLREADEIREMLDRVTQSDPGSSKGYFMLENGGYSEFKVEIDPDEWEVDLEHLTLLGELGHGNFGTVYEGRLKRLTDDDKEEEISVAVKTVKEGSSMEATKEFLEEACVMKKITCPHLVNLVGLVTQGEAYAIMEFMPHGDLKHYLRDIRPEKQEAKGFERMVPSASLFHSWASHVAQGMDYLSGRKLVHRDLAARNIMIDAKYVLRVGDFGLARDVYSTDYYRRESRTPLPLRWLAPESIRDGVFSTASDVWAYGIVLYEMATLAEQPYVGQSNEEVVRLLIHGGCMDVPIPALPFPNEILRVMVSCWKHHPADRPSFGELAEQLSEDEHCV